MIVRRIATVLIALSIGCARVKPPLPREPGVATAVEASRAKTWDALIDVFAEYNLPLRTLERASGYLATDPLPISEIGGAQFSDCGTAGKKPLVADHATYNVRVRGDSVTSIVKANTRYTRKGTQCMSRGLWEATLENDVKARAEGRPAAATFRAPIPDSRAPRVLDACAREDYVQRSGRNLLAVIHVERGGKCIMLTSCRFVGVVNERFFRPERAIAECRAKSSRNE